MLRLEHPSNDKEIVIHVNKLREGWDVKNVYTIIPLRAAKSDVLTEQTIGRGLRLPFGAQTGDDDLDTLEIAAHDHFAAIVREAHAHATRTGVPVRTKEIGEREREETEVVTVEPRDGPYRIAVPKLASLPTAIKSEGTLSDFPIQPRRVFGPVATSLVGTVLGGTEQRAFDVPPYEMSEDPVRFLVRVVFDKCSAISSSDANDLALVPSLVRRYLGAVDANSTAWRRYVQAHAAEMVADLVEQIGAHVVARTEVAWQATGEEVPWRAWSKSVPKGTVPKRFDEVPDDACTKCLLAGYERTIYPINAFDSKQEKWLADIFEREPRIRAWVRVPVHSFAIAYGGSDYSPDFVVEADGTVSVIEMKRESELGSDEVRRKAAAAERWCEAAADVSGQRWEYVLLSHNDVLPTDSFDGMLAKRVVL